MRKGLCIALLMCAALTSPASAQLPGLPTPTPPDAPPVVAAEGPAASFRMDGADSTRRGWVAAAGLVPPLRPLWSVKVPRLHGGLVVGDGRLFATTRGGIQAVDLRSGRRLWRTPGYGPSGLAYADGVLVVTLGHRLSALDAATGALRWESPVISGSRPAILGGTVLTQYNELSALDLQTGELLWANEDAGGDNGAPAGAGDRVYVRSGCAAMAVDRRNGRTLWQGPEFCAAPVAPMIVDGDRVYTGEATAPVRAATDGTPLPGPVVDSIAAGVGFRSRTRSLVGFDLASGRRRWSLPLSGGPYNARFGPPLAVGELFVRTRYDSLLQFSRIDTGASVWTGRLRGLRDIYFESPIDATAGEGVLVLGRGRTLAAFGPSGGRSIAVPVRAPDPYAVLGESVALRGRLAGDLFPALRLEADEFPFGRFRTVAEEVPDPAGRFEFQPRPTLTTRLRIAAADGTGRSRTYVVAVPPRVTYRVRNVRNVVTATMFIRGDRSVRMKGRRAVLYVVDRSQERLRRLGSATVRGRGTGRGTATVTFRALREVGRRDYLFTCLPGIHRVGQGVGDLVQRRCGAARIDY